MILLNRFLTELLLPPDSWLLCKWLFITSNFLEKARLYVSCIVGTLYFCAECCLVLFAGGSPYTSCSITSSWGLCCSRLESRILWLLVLSSKFSLSNFCFVKMFVSLCSPRCSVSFALSVQQRWRVQLPFPFICVNECFYSLFFSLVLSFVRSSFGASWICWFFFLFRFWRTYQYLDQTVFC